MYRFLFIVSVIIFLGSCLSPDRESQWMNIPRDSGAVKTFEQPDSLLKESNDSHFLNDTAAAR